MAKAYKCDRCGNYFEKIRLPHDGEYFILKVGGLAGKTYADICESCNSKFQIWMNEFKVTSDDGDLVDKTIEAVLGGERDEKM